MVEYKPLENGVWFDTEFMKHEIESDRLDIEFKPGFYRQMTGFLDMLKSGELDWPGQNLGQVLKTMILAERFCKAG